MSQGHEDDVLKWAESLIAIRQYHRAAHILKEAHLESSTWQGCFLTANAMYLANDIENACKILESSESLFEKSTIDAPSNSNKKEVISSIPIRPFFSSINILVFCLYFLVVDCIICIERKDSRSNGQPNSSN